MWRRLGRSCGLCHDLTEADPPYNCIVYLPTKRGLFPPFGGKRLFHRQPHGVPRLCRGPVRTSRLRLVRNKRIEGVGGSVPIMGRVRGAPFRRRRSHILGEAAVAVLLHEQRLTSSQIAERISPVLHQYRFNNQTLGWIVVRTKGVTRTRQTEGGLGIYEVDSNRIPDLPQKTLKRLEKELEKYHSPTGNDG